MADEFDDIPVTAAPAQVSQDPPKNSPWYGRSKLWPGNPYGYLANADFINPSTRTGAFTQGAIHGASWGLDNVVDSDNQANNSTALAAHPGYYIGGNVAGAVPGISGAAKVAGTVLPNIGRVAQAAIGSGTVGAVNGAAAPADSIGQRAQNTAVSGGLGVLTSLGGSAASAIIGKGVTAATGTAIAQKGADLMKATFGDETPAIRAQIQGHIDDTVAALKSGKQLTVDQANTAQTILNGSDGKTVMATLATGAGNATKGATAAAGVQAVINAEQGKPLTDNLGTAAGVGAVGGALGIPMMTNPGGVVSAGTQAALRTPVIGPAIQRSVMGLPQSPALATAVGPGTTGGIPGTGVVNAVGNVAGNQYTQQRAPQPATDEFSDIPVVTPPKSKLQQAIDKFSDTWSNQDTSIVP